MVKRKITIGVIGIQGAVSEHVHMMNIVFSQLDINGIVRIIKPSDSVTDCDGIILPGGESTTISRVLQSSGLYDAIIKKMSKNDLVVMGTCAGCILVAHSLIDNTKDITLLNLIQMSVRRNAYGSQKESFEQQIDISQLYPEYDAESIFPAVFIRAPIIEKINSNNVSILAKDSSNRPVMVKEGNCLALTFHPELSMDTRIHEYFFSLVKNNVLNNK